MVGPDVLDTNVDDNLPRNVRDETVGRLRKGLSRSEGAYRGTDIAYLRVGGPKAAHPHVLFKELLFCLLRPTKRSWVRDVAKVLV